MSKVTKDWKRMGKSFRIMVCTDKDSFRYGWMGELDKGDKMPTGWEYVVFAEEPKFKPLKLKE